MCIRDRKIVVFSCVCSSHLRLRWPEVSERRGAGGCHSHAWHRHRVTSENCLAYKADESTVWWSFSSCTTKISVLKDPMFLGPTGDRTIFQVHTRRGVSIAPFSAVKSEAEVLLPAGTPLRITDVLPKDASGLTIVTCEDDDDAPALIA